MSFRPHRILVSLLLFLATWVTVAAIGVHWIDHQLLSTPNWTRTSRRMIANGPVRRAIADFSVDQAFGAAGIDSAISHVLPGAAATTVQGTLHHVASGESDTLLSTRAGRQAWTRATRQAQADLLSAVRHPGRRQGVVLDLSPLLRDVVQSVAGSSVAEAIPGSSQVLSVRSPSAGRLVVLRPAQLHGLRAGVRTAQTLGWALPLIGLGLFALALIIAYGWRAAVLSRVGYALGFAGAIALALRAVLQYPLSTVFVASSTDRAAVRAAWLIGTSDLRTTAIEVLIAGAAVAVVGWVLRFVAR
jgi:hypothetical protein